MSLPILNYREEGDERRLLRLAGQARAQWSRHLGEEMQLDVGVAVTNAALAEGNCVVDVALPEGSSVEEVMAAVGEHFGGMGVKCRKWNLNPTANMQSIGEHLVSLGYRAERWDVLYLRRAASVAPTQGEPVTIIPARASYRHVEELFGAGADVEESKEPLTPGPSPLSTGARGDGSHAPGGGAGALLHLDDPHTDAVLALRDGRAVGYVAVLAMGEVGLIEDLYVLEGDRGSATVMMNRAVEICARSQFRYVFTFARDGETAKHLSDGWGFAKIGEAIDYLAPA